MHKHLYILAFVAGAVAGYFLAGKISTLPIFSQAYDLGTGDLFATASSGGAGSAGTVN